MLPEKLIDFVKDITGELKGLPCGLVVSNQRTSYSHEHSILLDDERGHVTGKAVDSVQEVGVQQVAVFLLLHGRVH